MTTATYIRVPGLTELDQLEMSNEVKQGLVQFQEERMPGGKFGDLVIIGVVTVTYVGLQALAAWLMKTTKHNKLKKSIEIIYADGTKSTEVIELDLSSSAAPKADVLKALAKMTNVNLADLLQGDGAQS
jgi:hypothetical protein